MNTTTHTTIPAEVMAELHEALDQTLKGTRDPEAARRSCERMDRMREDLRQRQGEMNLAVELIREGREE